MNKTAVKDLLLNRVTFKIDGASPDSGKYFEGEHPIITLDNIKNSQPSINISSEEFNTYLEDLKTDVIYQVLSDVFDRDTIDDNLLDYKPALFDNAISKQMAIKVINLIITSIRISNVQRLNADAVKQIYVDLNTSNGILFKYDVECDRIKKSTGGNKRLSSITTK